MAMPGAQLATNRATCAFPGSAGIRSNTYVRVIDLLTQLLRLCIWDIWINGHLH